MSDDRNPGSRIAAFQVLVFEMNWSVFDWIDRVQFAEDSSTVSLHVCCREVPDRAERDACTAMFQEIFEAAYADSGLSLKVDYGAQPNSGAWIDLMSPALFKKMASELAPWRLERGR